MTKLFSHLLLLLTLAAAFAGTARPQQPQQTSRQENVARITVIQITGEVYVSIVGETYRFALRTGSMITGGQMIATGPKASVMLAFSNGATVTIGESSLVSVDEFLQTPFSETFKMSEAAREPSTSQTRLDLVRGELISNVKKLNKDEGSTFEIKTPLGVAGIRGTTFQIAYVRNSPKRADGSDSNTANFAIVMLEGTIELNVPSRARPIVLPRGKQLVLENIDIAATTGPTLSEETEPADAPAAAQALLMQRVQAMLNASASLTVPGTPGAPARPSVRAADAAAPAPEQSQGKGGQTQQAATATSVSPSPAPQVPAPRLSPTDGTAK